MEMKKSFVIQTLRYFLTWREIIYLSFYVVTYHSTFHNSVCPLVLKVIEFSCKNKKIEARNLENNSKKNHVNLKRKIEMIHTYIHFIRKIKILICAN